MLKRWYFKFPTNKGDFEISENTPLNYKVEVGIHQGEKNEALMIIVWKWWSVSWYMNKYEEITKRLIKYGINIFIIENPEVSWNDPELFFDGAMKFIKEKMTEFWFKLFKIKCFWFSAWWHFVGRFAYKYPNIKEILLVNPVLRVNFTKLKKELNQFTWNITIIQWDKDTDYFFNPLLSQIPKARNIILEWVNHQFSNKWQLETFIWLPEKYLFQWTI